MFLYVLTGFNTLYSGQGGYGDALNPWGDLIAMARAWCVLKPNARALVGVPSGPDVIEVTLKSLILMDFNRF
jgi:hypothetical protein